MIDDATSEIQAQFFESETTLGCLKVLRDYIANNGLFKVLYVDKAGIFGGPKRCNFSQVKRASLSKVVVTSDSSGTGTGGASDSIIKTDVALLVPSVQVITWSPAKPGGAEKVAEKFPLLSVVVVATLTASPLT